MVPAARRPTPRRRGRSASSGCRPDVPNRPRVGSLVHLEQRRPGDAHAAARRRRPDLWIRGDARVRPQGPPQWRALRRAPRVLIGRVSRLVQHRRDLTGLGGRQPRKRRSQAFVPIHVDHRSIAKGRTGDDPFDDDLALALAVPDRLGVRGVSGPRSPDDARVLVAVTEAVLPDGPFANRRGHAVSRSSGSRPPRRPATSATSSRRRRASTSGRDRRGRCRSRRTRTPSTASSR